MSDQRQLRKEVGEMDRLTPAGVWFVDQVRKLVEGGYQEVTCSNGLEHCPLFAL